MSKKAIPKVKPVSKFKEIKSKFLKKGRNFLIFSIIMMLLGGTADRYRKNIFDFFDDGYKTYIEKIISDNVYSDNLTTAKINQNSGSAVNTINYSNQLSADTILNEKINQTQKTKSEIFYNWL